MYSVSGQVFRTKGDVRAAAIAIRDSVPVGGTITGDDEAFMLDLLQHHEEAADKIRDGITELGTMRNAYGTVSFRITRTDGTSDDFSIDTCLKGLPKE